jgi:hypothetical protein
MTAAVEPIIRIEMSVASSRDGLRYPLRETRPTVGYVFSQGIRVEDIANQS